MVATPSGGIRRNCCPMRMLAGSSILFHAARSRSTTPLDLAILNSVSPCFTVYSDDGDTSPEANGFTTTAASGFATAAESGFAATVRAVVLAGGARSDTGAGRVVPRSRSAITPPTPATPMALLKSYLSQPALPVHAFILFPAAAARISPHPCAFRCNPVPYVLSPKDAALHPLPWVKSFYHPRPVAPAAAWAHGSPRRSSK